MSSLVHRAILLPVIIALSVVPTAALAQSPGTSPVHHLQPGLNELTLFERFTVILDHSSRIKSVLDFDAEVIRVETIENTPTQVRVYALQTGVTTITLIDEAGQQFGVEVLVRGDVRHLESYLRRLYPDDTITVEEIKGAVRLDGWVTKPEHVSEIEEIAAQFFPLVMNHMKVGGVQQVLLKCTVMEVQRAKVRKLGLNWSLNKPDGYLISTPGPITPLTGLAASGNPTFAGFAQSTITFGFTKPNSVFRGFLQAAREEGLLKLNATPSLVTHNGRPAHLLNGGETPILVPAGLGTVGIEFKEFGIQLDAVPYILGNGRVRLEIDTAVRDRDFANAVTVNGVTVPAFIVRRASTQVEMNFGEALVIAGLISQREDATAVKVPFLGELPWIGTAFNRKEYREGETELIIMVQPELVAPLPANQMLPGGPGRFSDKPTDHELFHHNLLEVPKYGNECDGCFNCQTTGSCEHNGACEHSPFGCPSCRENGKCVPTGSASADLLIRPGQPAASDQEKTIPASLSTQGGTGTRSQLPIRGASASGSGLISPTMR
jgi:pilus assembly protein CpaC